MTTNARWGAAFALLAAGIAVAMALVVRDAHLPAPPQTTLEYQFAYRPLLAPLLRLFAFDQMFVVAYSAAFVAAALSWRRPLILCGVAILAALTTAGADTLENLRSVTVIAGLADGPPAATDLDQIDHLTGIKWLGAGVTGLALGLLAPRRGMFSVLFAVLFGIYGLAALTLGAAVLHLAPSLTALQPSLSTGVIAGLPIGLVLLAMALLALPRRDA